MHTASMAPKLQRLDLNHCVNRESVNPCASQRSTKKCTARDRSRLRRRRRRATCDGGVQLAGRTLDAPPQHK